VRWTKLVADFESCDLSQREFANERGVPLSNQPEVLAVLELIPFR